MSPTKVKKKLGLLETFEQLDRPTKIQLSEITKPSVQALATLYLAKYRYGLSELSAEHVEVCLDFAGVNVSKESITKSLSRAGDVVKSFKAGPDTYYKIMTKGELIAEDVLEGGNLKVVQIDAGTPRTSRKYIESVLLSLKGTVYICDPYYGHKTFDSLDKIPKSVPVRFLSCRTSEDGSKLKRTIRAFKKEYPKTEIRIAVSGSKIHDRFLTDKKRLYLIGHGLKDIGEGDSFVIELSKATVPDLIRQVAEKFEEQWNSATPL